MANPFVNALLNLMPNGTDAARGLSSRTKNIIVATPWVAFIILGLYSVYEDFGPSESVIEYGLFVWVPLTLGYSLFMVYSILEYHRNPVPGKETTRLRATVGAIVSPIFSLFLIHTITIYGVPAVINAVVGEPFQAQAMVTEKFWNSSFGHRLYLANYKTVGDGNVGSEKPVWKEVSKGDIVAVSGVQSIWGQSIHSVTQPQLVNSDPPLTSSATIESANPIPHEKASSQKLSTNKLLLRAIKRGESSLVELFLRHGADVNGRDKEGSVPLGLSQGHLDLAANYNTSTREGTTPLEYAAMKGNIEVVKLLLLNGANIHLKDEGGETPFFTACAFGHSDIAELLAEKGANIDEPNIYGTTPLIIASLTGRTAVVKFLLDKGANVNTRDGLGNTPLSAAKKMSLKPQPEIVKLLEERGAKE
jgi:ankyrin repeat protein